MVKNSLTLAPRFHIIQNCPISMQLLILTLQLHCTQLHMSWRQFRPTRAHEDIIIIAELIISHSILSLEQAHQIINPAWVSLWTWKASKN